MIENIVIRKAKISDFNDVHKLVVQVHKLHLDERDDIYKDVNPMNLEDFIVELSNPANIYFVAELENKVVGICFSQLKNVLNNKIMKNRKILNINTFCVGERYQRKGIGKILYNEIVQFAKEKNVDCIELMVWGFNENAIAFYENLGMNVKNLKFEQKLI